MGVCSMKKLRRISAVALVVLLIGLYTIPAFAAFDQNVLNGIVMIRTGAPDEKGTMNY